MKLRIEPNKRPFRSRPELQSDSKTVQYELKMLICLAQGFSAPPIQADPIARNAYIESFAVHCRALICFLYGHLDEITAGGNTEKFARVYNNDVFAIDYHHRWADDCPQPTGLIVQSKRRADKHVAHITTDRREVNQPGSTEESVWDLSGVASAICTPFEAFLRKVPPQNLDATELRRMNELIAEWTSAAKVQFVSLSEPPSPPVCLQAKTEACTLSPSHSMFGKTE